MLVMFYKPHGWDEAHCIFRILLYLVSSGAQNANQLSSRDTKQRGTSNQNNKAWRSAFFHNS